MRIVKPLEITPALLDSTNVVNDYADWASTTTYNTGDRVVHNELVWEALKDSVTSEPLETNETDWLRVGFSNKWRMFRQGRDSVSTRDESIDVSITPNQIITTLAALGLDGFEASLTVTDLTEGVVFGETQSLVDIGVGDWWEYHFLPTDKSDTAIFNGIPPFSAATYDLTVAGATTSSTVEAGRIVMGIERTLGVTNFGTSVSTLDFSKRERDEFGNLELIPRRVVRLVDYDATVETGRLDAVVRLLQELSATPTLFIGDEIHDSTITFGVYRDFTQGITNVALSDLTIQVEGF